MNSSNANFTVNSTNRNVDSRDTITISIEDYEELIQYKQICRDLFAEFKEELL